MIDHFISKFAVIMNGNFVPLYGILWNALDDESRIVKKFASSPEMPPLSERRTCGEFESFWGIAPLLHFDRSMKKAKQLELFKKDKRYFGGLLLLGKRKGKRPFSSKEPLHLVMRSSWAKGVNSFLQARNKKSIQRLIQKVARNYSVKVYRHAIVGNHLHLVILAPKLKNYQTFIRVLSSQIASHVMRWQSFREFQESLLMKNAGDPPVGSSSPGPRGAGDPPTGCHPHPGRNLVPETEPQGKEQQFWQMRPFTRLLHWGKDFRTACKYVTQNTLEALGFIPYAPRKDRYRRNPKPGDPHPGDPRKRAGA